MLPPLARTRLLLSLFVLVVLALAWPRSAHADQVDKLIAQLNNSTQYKVRLSAALNLAKIGDRRAIPVFIKALKDSDKTVRGVVAAGLAKLVTSGTPKDTRGKAIAALKISATKDSNAFVRKQAQKTYDSLKSLEAGTGTTAAVASGSIYVNIGGMSAETENSGTIKSLMRTTAQKTFRSKASKMVIDWPGGTPTAKQIKDKKVAAFYVDGTVNEIKVASGLVQCKVSMLLATFPEKSMFGFLKGGAAVEGNDVGASGDCVAAVIEDLIAKKIIPTIQARAGN